MTNNTNNNEIYIPYFEQGEWILRNPYTKKFYPGKIIGYIDNSDSYLFFIIVDQPIINLEYDNYYYPKHSLIKYNYNQKEFSDEITQEEMQQIMPLDDEIAKKITESRISESNNIQYTFKKKKN